MWSCVYLLEHDVWQASKTRHNHWGVRNVPICVQTTINPNEKCAFSQIIIPGARANANRRQAFSSETSDTYTAIRILHAERVSSERPTWWRVCIQLCRSAHQSRHLRLVCFIKENRSNGRRAGGYRAHCKHARFLTIELYCGCTVLLGRPHIMFVVLALVKGGLWDPKSRSVWSSAIQWFHIFKTVVDFRQCDGRYHGTIVHTLDWQLSCIYRILTLADQHFLLSFET